MLRSVFMTCFDEVLLRVSKNFSAPAAGLGEIPPPAHGGHVIDDSLQFKYLEIDHAALF